MYIFVRCIFSDQKLPCNRTSTALCFGYCRLLKLLFFRCQAHTDAGNCRLNADPEGFPQSRVLQQVAHIRQIELDPKFEFNCPYIWEDDPNLPTFWSGPTSICSSSGSAICRRSCKVIATSSWELWRVMACCWSPGRFSVQKPCWLMISWRIIHDYPPTILGIMIIQERGISIDQPGFNGKTEVF